MTATAPMIGFAGMTHLGINSAAAAANRGFRVIGFDPDIETVAMLKTGIMPVAEPDLDDTVAAHRSELEFTADAARLRECDVVYVSIDVPTDDTGAGDLASINSIVARVDAAMHADAILVILCQVPPGYTRALPRAADLLYYQVETLIFGCALKRALYPERFIVGCADPHRPLPVAYARFLEAFDCPILPMRYESAELAKISINMCLVASISAANTLAELCERIGADWSEIVPALRLDRRIGEYSYISPGLGISGGNLERDLATVLRMADAHGTDGGVVAAWVANSKHRKAWVHKVLMEELLAARPDATLCMLGIAYKEHTDSTKNAPALAVLDALGGAVPVRAYDPMVPPLDLGANVQRVGAALDAVDGADAVAVMTPWPEFSGLDLAEIAGRMNGRLFIDPYRMFDPDSAAGAGLAYRALGFSAPATAETA